MSHSSPPSTQGSHRSVVYRYRVNAQDAFVFVNQAFLQFASQNDAPDLCTRALYGRSMWDCIREPSVVEVYRALMHRVRRDLEPIVFPFRCDAPGMIRFMEMRIIPQRANMIEFQTQLLRMEARPFRSLLARSSHRNAESLFICSWCKRVRIRNDVWLELDEAQLRTALIDEEPLPKLNHTDCPECAARLLIPLDASPALDV